MYCAYPGTPLSVEHRRLEELVQLELVLDSPQHSVTRSFGIAQILPELIFTLLFAQSSQ